MQANNQLAITFTPVAVTSQLMWQNTSVWTVNESLRAGGIGGVGGEVAPVSYISLWLRVVFIAIYCIIFIVGLSGNTLVVYVVVRSKPMQTITNLFIVNLAISDVMMCLLAIPFTPLSYFLNDWVFGSALCNLVPMTLGVSVYVSTLSSTVIAVDRYFVIVHPFKPRMTTPVCLIVIGIIWFLSSTISLPLAVFHTEVQERGRTMCEEQWPSATAQEFFTVASLLFQYIVPCAAIAFCYMQVSRALQRRERRRAGLGSSQREEADIRRKRRTNRMLIAMVAIFMCCWLPLNVVLMAINYFPAIRGANADIIFFVAHIIAMSSTMYNLFLYGWMNDGFRKEFQAVFPCLRRWARKRRILTDGTTTIGEKTNNVMNTKVAAERDCNVAQIDGECLQLQTPIDLINDD